MSRSNIDGILPDADKTYSTDDKVTVLLHFERDPKSGHIIATQATRQFVIRQSFDTGLTLYPVAMMNWDKVRDSYHGQACITGLIPNQIFVNKLFAMAMKSVADTAFPKILFDSSRISKWSNKVGEALGTAGDPTNSVMSLTTPGSFSPQVMQLIDATVSYTRDFMGASDAALGNVRPDNSSAIIAVQKASVVPLENQRRQFYRFVEDCVRIIIDMMSTYYGAKKIVTTEYENAKNTEQYFDFSQLSDIYYRLAVNVGASSYFSELMQVQTVDNLFVKGIISDPIDYLQAIPEGYIKGRDVLIDKIKKRQKKEIKQDVETN